MCRVCVVCMWCGCESGLGVCECGWCGSVRLVAARRNILEEFNEV
jgi:hypothetical protein